MQLAPPGGLFPLAGYPPYHLTMPRLPAVAGQPAAGFYLAGGLQPQLLTEQFALLPGYPVPAVSCPPPTSPTSSAATFSSLPGTPSSSSGGTKRKASIPPSPEQSPQGPYIGQHSQGLGGHYADSYWNAKRPRRS